MRFSAIILAFFVACFLLAIVPAGVSACSCAHTPSPAEATEKADAVFAGEVIGISDEKDATGFVSKTVHIQVNSVWKGPSQAVFKIATGAGGGDCGYDFTLGKSYLVYAYKKGEIYSTNICSRTQLIEQAGEDLSVLGKGDAPAVDKASESGSSSVFAKVVLFAVAVGLVAVNLLFLQKQRKKIR